MPKRTFTPEDKKKAIELVFYLGNVAEAARRLDLPKASVYKWFQAESSNPDVRQIRDLLEAKVIQEGMEFVRREINKVSRHLASVDNQGMDPLKRVMIVEKCARSIRAVGSLIQRHEISGPGGGPIETSITIAWPGDDK